ncbi:M56 family metallopeptidase [Cryobacterium tagatosivorans]|uniref:M56 family peptidase n=1 Tax=Cryobacterium tagatosivorans TaxID=1259199 RepID=A0A4R8UGI9_9MICO|nr:M56 family metallopeptidase [Cryobacterium tagatosivorans]TFB51992.1 M56 family peptidase [Cryobacterium tagatosivorans]
MFAAAASLGIVAVALAWPVPILLAASRWPARAPGVALVLWQSIALAGGLAMIGSLLAYGLLPFGTTLPGGILGVLRQLSGGPLPAGTSFAHLLALCAALLLGGHLLLNLATTFARAEHQRRRHLHLIGLLSEPLRDRPGTRVIAHAAPVAYCLPGATRSATVLSEGLLRLLDADQLRGVIAHERAHLRQQHHLVLLAFKSWHSALPWFPIANRAENAVALLVEMLADDQARRHVDDRTLATAIALVGSAGHALPGEDPAFAGSAASAATAAEPGHAPVAPRVRRLLAPEPCLTRAAGVGAGAAAAGLLALPVLLLLLA